MSKGSREREESRLEEERLRAEALEGNGRLGEERNGVCEWEGEETVSEMREGGQRRERGLRVEAL